jgi:hypothetical protein
MNDSTLIPVPPCFKSSLKMLHISIYDGSDCGIRFIEFILKNARLLEEIQITYSSFFRGFYKHFMNLADVKNQLEGMGSCDIKFRERISF